jgi:hypothetical protein
MSRIERRIRDAVNPLSTSATRWWCHSALRRRLTGHGPAARQRRPAVQERGKTIRTGHARKLPGTITTSADQMKTSTRRTAVDQVIQRED